MKFTNGYWMIRDGVDALYAREAYELAADATTESLNVLAPTSVVRGRYDTLNLPTFNVDITTPAEGVIRVCVCRTLARRHRIPRIPAQCRRTRQP